MEYRIEVIADSSGKWAGNAVRYESVEAAKEAAVDLAARWLLVREWRVVGSDDAVKATSHDRAPVRYALVRGADLITVRAYLPGNYTVLLSLPGQETVISGVDDHGWTLDDYVIPRFASGLIGCEEITEQRVSELCGEIEP